MGQVEPREVGAGESRLHEGRRRPLGDERLEERDGLVHGSRAIVALQAPDRLQVPFLETRRVETDRRRRPPRFRREPERAHEPLGEPVLDGEELGGRPFHRVGSQRNAVDRREQGVGDPDAVRLPLNGAAEKQVGSQLSRDLVRIGLPVRHRDRSARRHDLDARDVLQSRADRLDQAVSDQLAPGQSGEIPEGKDREVLLSRNAARPGRADEAPRREQAQRGENGEERGGGGATARSRDGPGRRGGLERRCARARSDRVGRHDLGERLLDLDPRVADVAQAAARILLQAASEQVPDARRRRRREKLPARLRRHDRREDVRRRLSGECPAAGQHLVDDAAESPDVGPLVDRLSARLLRAHELRRAEDDARLRPFEDEGRREGGVRVGAGLPDVEHLRETEIEDFDPSFRRHFDVGRFQVAVDDPALVRRFERLGDLPSDGQ